jgi:EF-P beta-lysylation protein EpmB
MREHSEPWPSGDWRRILAEAVTDVDELLRLVELDHGALPATPDAPRGFQVRVPRGFIARIRRGDPHDPLLRQVLPVAAENRAVPGFSDDPLAELAQPPTDGVLHKYSGRALVLVTGACAVHCRYCFRRHVPFEEWVLSGDDYDEPVARVAADPSLHEVILSGGDPLVLPDARLEVLARRLVAPPHVRRLRIHTRLPIVLPQRVDTALTTWIASLDVPVVVVVHVNHANEIDRDVRRAMAALGAAGALLLNQAVLLAGVNDSANAVADLSEALLEVGVLPYYLHLLDPVAGAAHFEVPESLARELMRDVAARLPGYLVPRLVREVPGAPAKTAIDVWS